MPDTNEIKELFNSRMETLESNLKLHINYVVDKQREDFDDKLKTITEVALQNKNDINFLKKAGSGLAALAAYLGWDSVAKMFH